MRIAIFYLTGTGNTHFVAQELRAAFGAEHPTDLFDIGSPAQPPTRNELAGYDLLIFGGPVLGFNPPRYLCRFLARLPQGEGRKAMVFLNAGGDKWADTGYAAAILRRRGYDVAGRTLFLTPSNMVVRTIDEASGEMTFELLGREFRQDTRALFETCRREAGEFARQVLAGSAPQVRFGFFSRLVFAAVRAVFFNLACPMLRFHLRVTPECNGCGVCVRTCPTANIRLKQGRPRFGSNCTVCYRCLNICPKRAVRFRRPFGALDNKVSYLCPGWKAERRGG